MIIYRWIKISLYNFHNNAPEQSQICTTSEKYFSTLKINFENFPNILNFRKHRKNDLILHSNMNFPILYSFTIFRAGRMPAGLYTFHSAKKAKSPSM